MRIIDWSSDVCSSDLQPTPVSQVPFFITLIASTFLMGSSFVAGKILIQQGFPTMMLVGWRFLVAALATLPLVLLDKGSLKQALFPRRSEEHTSELQSLMRISYAVFCLKKKIYRIHNM